MKWDNIMDLGFLVLLMIVICVFGWFATGCQYSRVSERCSEESHGICPWCEVEH